MATTKKRTATDRRKVQQIAARQAGRNFSDMISRVRYLGITYVLTRGGKPVAKIVPVGEPPDLTTAA